MNLSPFEAAAEAIRKSVNVNTPAMPLLGTHLVVEFERRIQRRAQTRRWVAGACALLLVGGYSAQRMHKPAELSYRVGTGAQLGVVGTYMSAPATQPLDLHFSEGSELVLQPKTRARVASTSSQGATVVLESGRAHADIVHQPHANWRIFAGPYVVGITGTSFEVSYDVSTQTFELDMKSGTVKVWGPGLVSPVEIRDTQRFVLSGNVPEATRDSAASKESNPPLPASQPSDAPKSATSATEAVVDLPATSTREMGSQSRASVAASPAANVPVESWSRMSAKGQHRRILELAEEQGLDTATATASGPDLLALGNSARFAGKSGVAVKAYRVLRERFSKSSEANIAAFFLGRLSESSRPSEAISWYERYVAEAPAGAWVADALGRRMVILNNTSGGSLAQNAAKDYLQRFPHGPYAGFARIIVGQ